MLDGGESITDSTFRCRCATSVYSVRCDVSDTCTQNGAGCFGSGFFCYRRTKERTTEK